MSKLSKSTLVSVVLRSLFIQAQFTFSEKLGTGFGFSVLPGLRKIFSAKVEFNESIKRHTGYFNTHPFLSSYLLGIILRLEEEGKQSGDQILAVKDRLAGLLGSLGDRFFWKYLKPAASVVCMIYILGYSGNDISKASGGIAAFLVIFNIPHLYYRIKGVLSGYKDGLSAVRSKSIIRIEKMNSNIQRITLLLIGMLFLIEINSFSQQGMLAVLVFLAAAGISFFFNHRKISPGLGMLFGLFISFFIVISASKIFGY